MSRLSLLVSSLIVLGALSVSVGCGIAPQSSDVCGPGNCTGCCTSTGECLMSASNKACGLGGETCSVCASDSFCSAGGVCISSGSGGGTGTGGGGYDSLDAGGTGGFGLGGGSAGGGGNSGTGGGGGYGGNDGGAPQDGGSFVCASTSIVVFDADASESKASFDSTYEADELRDASGGMKDLLMTQAWGVFAPSLYSFSQHETFSTCNYCVGLFLGCTNLTLPYGLTAPNYCTTAYLAQQGSISLDVTEGTRSDGSFAASLTGVTFQEWDFQNDQPISGGKCITVASHSFNLSWH